MRIYRRKTLDQGKQYRYEEAIDEMGRNGQIISATKNNDGCKQTLMNTTAKRNLG